MNKEIIVGIIFFCGILGLVGYAVSLYGLLYILILFLSLITALNLFFRKSGGAKVFGVLLVPAILLTALMPKKSKKMIGDHKQNEIEKGT